MQYPRGKASSFPDLVMLCVVLAHLLLDALGIYRILHGAALANEDSQRRYATSLHMMLGSDIGFLVISAAFSLAGTQWMLERRRAAGLPGYAAVCIGVLNALFAVGWSFLAASLMGLIVGNLSSTAGMRVAVTINVLLSYALAPLLILLSIWLVFRLFRERQMPAVETVALHGRALLIFGLFAWSWVMLALGLAVPMGAAYYAYANADANLTLLYLGPYAGSMVLALPAFLGAWLGLPAGMPVVQPVRLWLAATLAMFVCALVMAVLVFAAASLLHGVGSESMPGVGLSALISLVWFVVSTLLCWPVTRWLTR